MKGILRKSRRATAFAIALGMLFCLIFVADVSAKQKYKIVEEDGKQYIVFGSYEQDGNSKNGKEPIEWEVLGEDNNGILVVSRYILDRQPYYNAWDFDGTWKSSTLRKWLNKKFYNTAFNAREQKKINTVMVKNEDNRYTGMDGGKNTRDKIFCLSVDEILQYYDWERYYVAFYPEGYSQDVVICQDLITKARIEGSWYDCQWWLRTPFSSDYICQVDTKGEAGYSERMAHDFDGGVRPALYLKK